MTTEEKHIGEDGARLAATVVTPPAPVAPSGKILVCCPGSGYRRTYWTKPYLGGPSFAEFMVRLGHIVVAVDHLGMGESDVPSDPDSADLEAMGTAVAEVIRTVREEAARGTLASGMRPVPEPDVTLVGHSMGGAVTIVAQARHRAADRIAVLGTTTLELAGLVPLDADNGTPADRRQRAQELRAPLLWGREWADIDPLMDYDREPFRSTFYLDDVPVDVIEDDEADGVPTPRTALLEGATPGLFASRAALVEVPVFLAYGEHDLSPDPPAEVRAYGTSNDVTLFRLGGSAHCHNLALTRTSLWQRLAGWIS